MKLTKFVHSCLLVELDDKTILFDPGEFSWEAFSIDRLSSLDVVVITHEHPDHFHPPFVQAILDKFPGVHWISTPAVGTALESMGAKHVSIDPTDPVTIFSKTKHTNNEPLDSPQVDNIAVHVANRLTVGGDRHDLEETKDILAFSITAPWGSTRDAARMVIQLKPKYAFPLHDWHWNDEARRREYDRYERVLGAEGIKFIKPINGQAIEL